MVSPQLQRCSGQRSPENYICASRADVPHTQGESGYRPYRGEQDIDRVVAGQELLCVVEVSQLQL